MPNLVKIGIRGVLPLTTYQILFKSDKLFVAGRSYVLVLLLPQLLLHCVWKKRPL